MKFAILFHRIGPYHHARLKALGKRISFTAIESTGVDNTYLWEDVDCNNDYPVITLFPDKDIETVSTNEIPRRVNNVLNELRPDVIAIPGWSSPEALSVLMWCCNNDVPAVLMSDSTIHDERRYFLKELIKSRVVRLFSAAFVAGSPQLDYLKALGFPAAQSFTGYDVVDNDYFFSASTVVRTNGTELRKRYSLPKSYFLASNRFIEKKNLHRLLEAYAGYLNHTDQNPWSLVMLGDGPLRHSLVEYASGLGIANYVYFTGFKQYAELPIYYGLASTFIHSSISEQWGLVVNEAMASGLSVLVSNRCGCAPDLVINSVNGFTFDPYNVDIITKNMLTMSSGALDNNAMGNASMAIIKNWSLEVFSENILKTIDVARAIQSRPLSWLDRALLWELIQR